MVSLATPDDLENRLGRPLTDEELGRVEALIEDVSGSVEAFTGRSFARADHTMRTRVKRGVVRLPQRPVHSVDSVADIDGNDIPFTWDGLDRVALRSGRGALDFFSADGGLTTEQVVDITYDAGPEEIPGPIVGVASQIALRSLGVNPTETSTTQASVDGYAFTIGSIGGAGAYGVLPSEALVLRRFGRASGGTIRVGL